MDGNTYYYILSDADEKYSINVSVDLSITPFMEIGKSYHVEFYNDGQVNVIVLIKEKSLD